MNTLIVQLPARNPAVASEEWHLPELPFMLLDRRQNVLRSGRATLPMLPQASATVLMVAARDLVLLQLALPPVNGARLQQALPNVLEDLLIQDPQTCHIAVDRPVSAGGQRTVAAIDRNWFRFVIGAFAEAGHTRIKAVPIQRCLPQAQEQPQIQSPGTAIEGDLDAGGAARTVSRDAELNVKPSTDLAPLVAALLGAVMPTAPAVWTDTVPGTATPRELAIARGPLGEGLALHTDAVGTTLAALAGAAPIELYQLSGVPGSEPGEFDTASLAGLQPRALPFETLARAALQTDFDLCQFEFAAHPWRPSRATFKRWRVPIWLAGAAMLVAIVAGNLDWLMLSRQHAAMLDRQVELLMSTFPKTALVLDPPVQMTRQLDLLRSAAGELAPDDFLSLSNGLARSLSPLAPGVIAQIVYKEHAFNVTFAATANVDDNFAARLRANGLSSRQDGATWIIGSHP